jgi:hypothetical protein
MATARNDLTDHSVQGPPPTSDQDPTSSSASAASLRVVSDTDDNNATTHRSPVGRSKTLSPEQRSLRARAAAYALHAENDGYELTANARATFLNRFEKEVDPEGRLSVAERVRKAEFARKAYFTRLAMRSAAVRKANAERRG